MLAGPWAALAGPAPAGKPVLVPATVVITAAGETLRIRLFSVSAIR